MRAARKYCYCLLLALFSRLTLYRSKQVDGHRLGTGHSGVDEYPRKKRGDMRMGAAKLLCGCGKCVLPFTVRNPV